MKQKKIGPEDVYDLAQWTSSKEDMEALQAFLRIHEAELVIQERQTKEEWTKEYDIYLLNIRLNTRSNLYGSVIRKFIQGYDKYKAMRHSEEYKTFKKLKSKYESMEAFHEYFCI